MSTTKKKVQVVPTEYPKTLDSHPFYGLEIDGEQKEFRDAIWNPEKLVVFCNAKAGTGKTQIAVATANLLVQYGLYNGIVYIVSPTQEQVQGYIPGDMETKSAPYMEPLYEALIKIGVNPSTSILSSDNIRGMKEGTAYIECMTHTFLRGCNFENKVIILDESQNFYNDQLKKTLTRIHDNCKVIIIGHTGQVDLYKNPYRSGFSRYLEHFRNDSRTAVCELTVNHRGWISTHADELEF